MMKVTDILDAFSPNGDLKGLDQLSDLEDDLNNSLSIYPSSPEVNHAEQQFQLEDDADVIEEEPDLCRKGNEVLPGRISTPVIDLIEAQSLGAGGPGTGTDDADNGTDILLPDLSTMVLGNASASTG